VGTKVDEAKKILQMGNFILIHDSNSRENEVDLVISAERVTPAHVEQMRTNGGGLICVALHPIVADNFGLPYLTQIYEIAKEKFQVLKFAQANDIPYDERSAFSISVNHRRTYTGITDADRALTIRSIGKLGQKALKESMTKEFGKEFRTPGHVPLLRAADGLLDVRRGHTELSVALASLAEITPVVAICEMLDSETHQALEVKGAAKYAKKNNTILIEGDEIEKAWEEKNK